MTIKKAFYKNFSTKPVIVFIHGFSKRTTIPLDNAMEYFRNHGYFVVSKNLFDPNDENDDNPKNWIENANKLVEEALSIKEDVVVIGFSMGGVIASHLASNYPVKLLILLAPAFEYVTLKAVRETITNRLPKRNNEPVVNNGKLPENFVDAFKEVVLLCRNSLEKVVCKTIIFHGRDDEKIPVRSSEYAYQHLASKDKKLFLLSHANHNLMEDTNYYQDILSVIHQNIRMIEK